jgi:hypothetical protein
MYLFIQGFRLLQRRHLILDTPVSKVRSAPLGMVELSGLAVGPYTMVAPITAHLCYYHRTLVWEWKQSGRNKKWVQVAAECMHVPFFLDDNTARVMIDPRGADLDLHRDFQQEFCDSFFTTKDEVPENVCTFLLRHGVSTTNKIKVEEFCIKPKNALFVLGTLDENPGLELSPQPVRDDDLTQLTTGDRPSFSLGGAALSFATGGGNGFSGGSLVGRLFGSRFEDRPSDDSAFDRSSFDTKPAPQPTHVIHLAPDPGPTKSADMTQQQKIAAALMKAGISNPAAWAAAGVTPSALAANQGRVNQNTNDSSHANAPNAGAQAPPKPHAPSSDFDPRPPVVLMKGRNNPTFLISWRSQRDLARSLGWKCTLMIWGGPAVALLSLYCLLTLTHLI